MLFLFSNYRLLFYRIKACSDCLASITGLIISNLIIIKSALISAGCGIKAQKLIKSKFQNLAEIIVFRE
jgi:hypothetical protein